MTEIDSRLQDQWADAVDPVILSELVRYARFIDDNEPEPTAWTFQSFTESVQRPAASQADYEAAFAIIKEDNT
jgi:hypothetical protein